MVNDNEKNNDNKKEIRDKSMALVSRSFTGVMGTVDDNGIPQLKAMIKTSSDGLKEFWFCSNTSSKRVTQIHKNPIACLYFYDEKTFEGLMLTGKAEVSYDDKKRKEFWQDGMTVYYPLGCTDPDFALIKFTAYKGNYYHALKNVDFEIQINAIKHIKDCSMEANKISLDAALLKQEIIDILDREHKYI